MSTLTTKLAVLFLAVVSLGAGVACRQSEEPSRPRLSASAPAPAESAGATSPVHPFAKLARGDSFVVTQFMVGGVAGIMWRFTVRSNGTTEIESRGDVAPADPVPAPEIDALGDLIRALELEPPGKATPQIPDMIYSGITVSALGRGETFDSPEAKRIEEFLAPLATKARADLARKAAAARDAGSH